MSKAFTREDNQGPAADDIPEMAAALPPGTTNYMTADGAERLRAELQRLTEQNRPELVARARNDPDARRHLVLLDQRINQLQQSLTSAQVIAHQPGPAPRVTFGATVTVRDGNGATSKYRIVGAGEADPDRGWISWLSPFARALINDTVGARVRVSAPGGDNVIEIVEIIYE